MTTLADLQDFYKAQKARNPWAIAYRIVHDEGKPNGVNPLYTEEVAAAKTPEQKKSLMGKIVAGIEANQFNKSSDDVVEFFSTLSKDDTLQKLSPGMAALAGWWLSDNVTRGQGQPTAAQQREFERQIQQAMRKKGRTISKEDAESAMEKMEAFFQKDDNDTYVRRTPVANAVTANTEEDVLQKVMSMPPFAGARFDPTAHRWVKPENIGQTYAARGGKKRVRASGTGAHERSVSGHGKGRIRGEGAGAHKAEGHIATQRRKEGFTHGKQDQKRKGKGKQ